MTERDHQLWADRIHEAHISGSVLPAISNGADLSIADAYRIQQLLTERRLAGGATQVGWKIGYTSAAMRQQMRIEEPNFAPLTDSMVQPESGNLPSSFTQPMVEPEIALRMIDDLPPDCSLTQAAAAVGSAHAALEIVDSVWVDYRFSLADNTADGSSAAAVVVGRRLPHPVKGLDRVDVSLFRNNVRVGAGRGADAHGHPLNALRWLSGALARHHRMIRAGDIVITGGLTSAVPIRGGDLVRAVFDTDVEVTTSLPMRRHPFTAAAGRPADHRP